MSEIKCGKCGTPVGWHSRPGGRSVAVCATCDGEATAPKPSETEGMREWALRGVARIRHRDNFSIMCSGPFIREGEPAHVIEKSAYDKLVQSEKIWQANWGVAGTERLKLQQELTELRIDFNNLYDSAEKETFKLSSARREVEELKANVALLESKYIDADLDQERQRSAELLSALEYAVKYIKEIGGHSSIPIDAIKKHNSGKGGIAEGPMSKPRRHRDDCYCSECKAGSYG